MQKLAEISIRRPVFASMIILALVVVGAASYFRLGVDRFPSVDLPTVSVRTTLPGASPEEVETIISRPIEEVVNTVEGIDELRSVSGRGTSFVMATFNLDRDIDVAAQDVRDRVATVLNRLPNDVDPPVISKFNNEDSPILTIAISGDRSLRELTEIADKIVKVQLERSVGVGEVRHCRRFGTRHQRLGRRGPFGGLPDSNHRGSRRDPTAECRHTRRQCDQRRARAGAPYHGKDHGSERLSMTS